MQEQTHKRHSHLHATKGQQTCIEGTEKLVCQDIEARQQLGIKKYGTTVREQSSAPERVARTRLSGSVSIRLSIAASNAGNLEQVIQRIRTFYGRTHGLHGKKKTTVSEGSAWLCLKCRESVH